MTPPPLFLPLKAEYYEAFANGTKVYELRKYGKRWNERVCTPGRGVVLSRGYGKEKRMTGTILVFRKRPATWLCIDDQMAMRAIYGTLEFDVAVISIAVGVL